MVKNNISYFVYLFALGVFLSGCNIAHAAVLQIVSSSSTLSPGDTTLLQVVLDSEGIAVNNAEAVINFPIEYFEVISVNKTGSAFPLWVEDPAFSNITGKITFNGGVPTPGFAGRSGLVASILVKTKKVGTAEVSFSSAAVRANDGFGTDVLRYKQGKTFTIAQKEAPKNIVPEPQNSVTGPTIKISSLTHPDQNQWYKDNNPIFKWVVPQGSDAIQTGVDANNSGVPRVTYSPVISEKEVKDLADGVWYFKVRARSSGAWGPVDTHIVRIDTESPKLKDTALFFDETDKTLTVQANATDDVSGMDHYKIFINDNLKETVSAKEFIEGKYKIKTVPAGENNLRLVAIDRAGNSAEFSENFLSKGTKNPQIENIPSVVLANEQLLIRGTTYAPYEEVTVYIKNIPNANLSAARSLEDDTIVIVTKSDIDNKFFVLTPRLKSGEYEVWAESGAEGSKISSPRINMKVSSSVVTIGSLSMNTASFIILMLSILIIFTTSSYYIGSRHHIPRSSSIKHVSVAKNNGRRSLLALRRRIEKHLAILQETRRGRILTKEEKELKQAMEIDLDAVDEALQEQQDI